MQNLNMNIGVNCRLKPVIIQMALLIRRAIRDLYGLIKLQLEQGGRHKKHRWRETLATN